MQLKTFNQGKPTGTPTPPAPTQGRKHILYVEDEDMNWLMAAPNLREKYQLIRAKDAKEAFDAVRQFKFDCILMDIQLANSALDGIKVTQILRGRYAGAVPSFAADLPSWVGEVPIIFVTAYTARYSRDELIATAGGSEMISKPVNFVALALTISRLISARISAAIT